MVSYSLITSKDDDEDGDCILMLVGDDVSFPLLSSVPDDEPSLEI